jgi:hypothetical protein
VPGGGFHEVLQADKPSRTIAKTSRILTVLTPWRPCHFDMCIFPGPRKSGIRKIGHWKFRWVSSEAFLELTGVSRIIRRIERCLELSELTG